MDAKDLRTETALSERNNDGSKYSQSGGALQCNTNKTYQDIGSSPLAKTDPAPVRPCAVIGPDRVIPPPVSNDAYLKKGIVEPWPCPDNAYRRPPEYSLRMTNNHNPARNISPRQTFQENMPRIMVPPTYSAVKHNDEARFNHAQDRNASVTKNVKPNISPEAKYFDVPYALNSLANEHKNIRDSEMCVPSVNSPLSRTAPQAWPPGGVNLQAPRRFAPHELYQQYPQYPSCNGPRSTILPVAQPHRTIQEEASYSYPETPYQDGNIRFKTYPPVRDRYLQQRYEYIGNYSNPFHPPPTFPPHKYDIPKVGQPHPYSGYPHMKYLDNRVQDHAMDGYQRQTLQPPHYSVPLHNQVIQPAYAPALGNPHSKVLTYTPDRPVKSMAVNKLPYDNSKMYIEFENARPKTYPTNDSYFINEMARVHPVKNQMVLPNYPSIGMHSIAPQPYYRKDNPQMKPYEYMPHFRNFDHPMGIGNQTIRHLPQFSPNTLAMSPSDSSTSNDTTQTLTTSQEDCGYVSQSSTASARSVDSSINRLPNGYCQRYDYRYGPVVGTSPALSKSELNSNKSSKENKQINVRQFLQMWNEGDEDCENNNNNTKEIVMQMGSSNSTNFTKLNSKSQEQLYVLGLVNVPNEELSKYEHLQKVSKLPENIKGYNSLELLNQFEEAIESTKIKSDKSAPKDYQMPLKENIPKQIVEALPRPVSPLDVEAKISQSIIHKEVGCNFEIKPCSPKMLNVEEAALAQNILGERVIEKVTNQLSKIVKSPIPVKIDENTNYNKIKRQERTFSINENPSCKMVGSPYALSVMDSNNMDSVKTNYAMQDLEINSGVCLASLPQLDNEIELNFPEVNQQFINANRKDCSFSIKFDAPTGTEKTTEDSGIVGNDIAFLEPEKSGDNVAGDSEKAFTKLSKYRKLKINNADHKETILKTKAVRTDSVIIKNPENIKNIEDENINNVLEKHQNTPINLTSQSLVENLSSVENQNKNDVADIALDFSLHKTGSGLPIINFERDELINSPLSNHLESKCDSNLFPEISDTPKNDRNSYENLPDQKNPEDVSIPMYVESKSNTETVIQNSKEVDSECEVDQELIDSVAVKKYANLPYIDGLSAETYKLLLKNDTLGVQHYHHIKNDITPISEDENIYKENRTEKYFFNDDNLVEDFPNEYSPTQFLSKDEDVKTISIHKCNDNNKPKINDLESNDVEVVNKIIFLPSISEQPSESFSNESLSSCRESLKSKVLMTPKSSRYLSKELYSPWLQKLLLFSEGCCVEKPPKKENNALINRDNTSCTEVEKIECYSEELKKELQNDNINENNNDSNANEKCNEKDKLVIQMANELNEVCKSEYSESEYVVDMGKSDRNSDSPFNAFSENENTQIHEHQSISNENDVFIDDVKEKVSQSGVEKEIDFQQTDNEHNCDMNQTHESLIQQSADELITEEKGRKDNENDLITRQSKIFMKLNVENESGKFVNCSNIVTDDIIRKNDEILEKEKLLINHNINTLVSQETENKSFSDLKDYILQKDLRYSKIVNSHSVSDNLVYLHRKECHEESESNIQSDISDTTERCDKNNVKILIPTEESLKNNLQSDISGPFKSCDENHIERDEDKKAHIESVAPNIINQILLDAEKIRPKVKNNTQSDILGTTKGCDENHEERDEDNEAHGESFASNIVNPILLQTEESVKNNIQSDISGTPEICDENHIERDQDNQAHLERVAPNIVNQILLQGEESEKSNIQSDSSETLESCDENHMEQDEDNEAHLESVKPNIVNQILLLQTDEHVINNIQSDTSVTLKSCDENHIERDEDNKAHLESAVPNIVNNILIQTEKSQSKVKNNVLLDFSGTPESCDENHKERYKDSKAHLESVAPNIVNQISPQTVESQPEVKNNIQSDISGTLKSCDENHTLRDGDNECQLELVAQNLVNKTLLQAEESQPVVKDNIRSDISGTPKICDENHTKRDTDKVANLECVAPNIVNQLLLQTEESQPEVENNILSDISGPRQSCDENSIEREEYNEARLENATQNILNHMIDCQNSSTKHETTNKHTRKLKRSLSDSALTYKNRESDEHSIEYTQPIWPPKRKKIDEFNNSESNVLAESLCRIIQSSRRNSISSFYSEDVSFCILIDNGCVITEENEEEKVCFAELSEDCIAEINTTNEDVNNLPPQEFIADIDTTNEEEVVTCLQEDIPCSVENNLNFSNAIILNYDQEKSVQETWIDDVACVETVVSDDVEGDDIVVSPKDTYISECNESGICIRCEHTELMYEENISDHEAQTVDTYNIPPTNFNDTCTYGESHSTDKCSCDRDELEKILSETNSHKFSPSPTSDNINSVFLPNDTKNSEMPDNKENIFDSQENYLDLNKVKAENVASIIQTEATCNGSAALSCELSTDNVFGYKQNDDDVNNYTSSSSPEVSSTTSEEKHSSILLKITNYNGSRISQINEIKSNHNMPRCKFTEKNEYSYSGKNFPNRPLITKAAQKYIPPLKETIGDLKVKLTLPQQRLLKLKQLKISRNKPKIDKINNVNPMIPKKPKPNFEDVLKSIDESQIKMHKEKIKKAKVTVPKVVIKKNQNGSHYTSSSNKEKFNPDLTGRKWQPWVFLEKNCFIDNMAIRNKTKAIFNHRNNTYVLAENFKKYKSVSNAKFVISQPKSSNSSSGQLKYTIRLKHIC